MVEIKPYRPPEVNYSNNLTYKNKGQAPKSKKYRGKKTRTKSQSPEPEAETVFKGRCSDLEGCILELGLISLDKFSMMMKELGRYLGDTYNNSCKPAIITKTLATLTDQ